ncbi:hypothetical protein JTB14_017020 [Gonioctena quinquepunctata]|nr:hypothetical protein JTB14_017020 [Gonioctena quinquepunctata]
MNKRVQEFGNSKVEPGSVDTSELKYEGLDEELKKKFNKNKAETMKTGGGHLNYIVIDGPEKELLEVLSLSVHGLPSTVDSDSVLSQTKDHEANGRETVRFKTTVPYEKSSTKSKKLFLLNIKSNLLSSFHGLRKFAERHMIVPSNTICTCNPMA